MHQAPQGFRIEQGYPAHSAVLGACGQPEILYGACHRREVHLRHGPSSEDVALPAVGKRGNQQLAAIENTLDLEAHELVLALGQRLGGLDAFLLYESVNTCSNSRIADSHEPPLLHNTTPLR